jgi:D-mannonate dehydratase
MATGYTSKLVEDGQDFKDFVLQCARAFGACIEQRDDPIEDKPKLRKSSNYTSKAKKKVEKELKELQSMTKKQKLEYGKKLKDEDIKSYTKTIQKMEKQNIRVKNMIAMVTGWAPPTDDHIELKTFMLNQLTISISDLNYYYSELNIAKNKTPEKYYAENKEGLMSTIKYYNEQCKKENQSVSKSNDWILKLYDSIEKYSA